MRKRKDDNWTPYEEERIYKIIIWGFIITMFILGIVLPTACAKPNENGELYLWNFIPCYELEYKK